MVENLMREVRSNFQIIWTSEQLSAKKTNSGSVKKVYCSFEEKHNNATPVTSGKKM